MNNQHVNIICFDVPFPPDYGGAIDVFFKIRALSLAGVKIHLHCFEYGRGKQQELAQLCEEVIYYKRDKMWKGFLTDKPFIVQTRNAASLKANLSKNSFPIVFEGLHCCFYLADDFLKGRSKLVRMHNNEAQYYFNLAKTEKKIVTKLYFYEEYRRLLKYERILEFADHIFCISQSETEYYKKRFNHVSYLAPFHGNTKINSATGKGKYILYHGNLGVNENNEAAIYLIDVIFSGLDQPFIIAGNHPSTQIKEKLKSFKHIQLIENPDKATMEKLIREAHINLLPTFQNTGIKLKLINSLFNGRFCLVNSMMVENTGLEKYCLITNEAAQTKQIITELMQKDFGFEEINKRIELETIFSDVAEAKKIIALLS